MRIHFYFYFGNEINIKEWKKNSHLLIIDKYCQGLCRRKITKKCWNEEQMCVISVNVYMYSIIQPFNHYCIYLCVYLYVLINGMMTCLTTHHRFGKVIIYLRFMFTDHQNYTQVYSGMQNCKHSIMS